MLKMLILCFLFTVTLGLSTYPLVERAYDAPQCVIKNRNATLENQLGWIHVSNNLLADTIDIVFDFRVNTSFQVCQLCEKQVAYCNRSLSLNDSSIEIIFNSIELSLLPNESYTIQYSNKTATLSLKLSQSAQCGRTFGLILSIDVVFLRENLTLVPYVPCDKVVNRVEVCNFMPLMYQMNNCLATNDALLTVPTSSGNKKIHSPLYWYAQYLTNESMDKEGNEFTLCNEPLYTILYRSDLYLDHCDPARNQTARTAWYQMAIQVITIAYNQVREDYKWLWLHAVEILERNCDARYAPLTPKSSQPNSLFMLTLKRLNEANRMNVALTGEENQTLLCEQIRHHFELTYNQTMSQMLYNQWYYKVFKLLLIPDENMKLYAILLIALFCIIPFALLGVLSNAIYRLKNLHKVRIL